MANWHVSLRGPLATEVRDALGAAGFALTGLSYSDAAAGGVESETHRIAVEALTADEAIRRAWSAVDGLAVYVDEIAREVDTGDASGSTGAT